MIECMLRSRSESTTSVPAIFCVHTPYVCALCDNLGGHTWTWLHAVGFYEIWYKNHPRVLSGWIAEWVSASHPKLCWSLHLSAGQCTCSSCMANSGAASLWNSRINCSWQVATEQHGPLSSLLLHMRSDAIMNLSNTCHHRMWQIRGRR